MTDAVQELEQAAAICERIRLRDARIDEQAFVTGLLEPVGQFVGADMGAFRAFSAAASPAAPCTVLTLEIPDRVTDAYLGRYFKLDPARHILRRRLAGPVLANEGRPGSWTPLGSPAPGESVDGVPQQEQRDFLCYRGEFLVPNRLYHHLGFCFQSSSGESTFLFDFHRTSAALPFGRLELARARLLSILLAQKLAGCRAEMREPRPADPATAAAPAERLGARQREVAELVALGLANKEIAAKMGISVRTVENHLRSIFAKLGVSRRAKVAAKLRS